MFRVRQPARVGENTSADGHTGEEGLKTDLFPGHKGQG